MRCTLGILIKGSAPLILGEGSISYKNDQFCAHPSVLSYENVVVSLNGWVHTLQECLDASGYTAALHSALSDVASYVNAEASGANAGASGMADLVKLTNSAVASGKHQQSKFGNRGKTRDDEGIDGSSHAKCF